MAEKLVAFAKLDQYMADRANLGSSQFRAALQGLLPSSTATPSASVAQVVQQRADGSFPNPVRDANVAGRIWVATVNGALLPGYVVSARATSPSQRQDGGPRRTCPRHPRRRG